MDANRSSKLSGRFRDSCPNVSNPKTGHKMSTISTHLLVK